MPGLPGAAAAGALSGQKANELAVARLNASLRAIERDVTKELSKQIREVANSARDEVRRSTRPPFRTGRTRKGVKSSVRRKYEASLYSLLPQAPIFEFGGT